MTGSLNYNLMPSRTEVQLYKQFDKEVQTWRIFLYRGLKLKVWITPWTQVPLKPLTHIMCTIDSELMGNSQQFSYKIGISINCIKIW